MNAVITRACEYMGHQYVLGEEVLDGEDGAKLVRLGFAGWPNPDEAPVLQQPVAQTGVTDFVPEDHAAQDVVDYAKAHPSEVSALIEAETDGKDRVTVIAALTALLEENQGE